jgi:TolB-like protein/lipoprotein NlpI
MFSQPGICYEFGPFQVDTRERQLLRDGRVVPLRPKVFDTLLVLVQNSGHTLTKEDMMKRVWSDTAVEEGNLSRTISTLRNALGERPNEDRYIKTIPWRGYRFVASVKELRNEELRKPVNSLAVLPFVNTGGNPATEYLADGITEGLIADLARLTDLRVISRNSVFRFKGSEVEAQRIGRELKVEALLLGRIAESDEFLSISVELIDTTDDRHIWGAQYIRNPQELVATCETIARNIREKLRLDAPSSEERADGPRHTQNHEAYVCYLKGRYHFNKLSPEGVQKAQEYLGQAIEKDPTYALAYASLADCHNYLAQRDDAKKALLKALELNEDAGEAHASLAFFRFLYEWNFSGAEDEFKRALALNPNYAEAHHWYAIFLANLGRHQEADEQARQAVALDPLSLLMMMTPAMNFFLAREYDRAVEQLHAVLDMDPNFVAARSVLGIVLVHKGLFDEGLRQYQTVLDLIKGAALAEDSVKALIAYGYAKSGRRNDALSLLEEVLAPGITSPYSIAAVWSALGDRDVAFEWLDKAFEQRDLQMVSLKVDPSFDGVRDDSRFAEIMNRVGLPQG